MDDADDEPLTLSEMLRAARHYADLSQRELAALVGISKSYLGDLESGDATAPSYPLVAGLIEAAGLRLVALDPGARPVGRRPLDTQLNRGERHWPAHLQLRRVVGDEDWWYSRMLPGERPLPECTADWRRALYKRRVRRRKGETLEQARERVRPSNTPRPPEVSSGETAGG